MAKATSLPKFNTLNVESSPFFKGSEASNFIYKITNLKLDSFSEINSLQTIKDRIQTITKNGGLIKITKYRKSIFLNNLVLIDSNLPEILAELLLIFYQSDKLLDLSEALIKLNNTNHLKSTISKNHSFYQYKVKRFLLEVAHGMNPLKVWTGSASGHSIRHNEEKPWHKFSYNQADLADYLLNNIEFANVNSKQKNNDFGLVYEENGDYFIKLNLEFQFKKEAINLEK